ncbi:MAG: bifunctional UDP-N-acetylmuramoyl-tripeptide:D-alanyl-D-alanine ligase/alanine racemase [Bacteroidales bacterium]|nr:bifunctional UDP-N-acetylmuramoyl-tripeptide:D-alanyl-D-alanine ligase/alanine racemase [Bacteroidales bacterium]
MGFEWTLNEIGSHIHGTIHGDASIPVSTLAIDSRTLAPSEATMFVALVGEQHDGHDYIKELYGRGIRAFLVSRLPDISSYVDAGFCLVENTLAGLQEMAAARRQTFEGTVAAITGSNGKTIVKEWIYQCLSDQFSVHRSPKSYNSQVGVPLSVWMIGEHHELAIIEAGISRPGEMEKLRPIIQPEIGLFTNLGTAHQKNFKSLEEKLGEKLLLFSGCKKVICRSDVGTGSRTLKSYLSDLEAEIIDWSIGGKAAYTYQIGKKTSSRTEVTAVLPNGQFSFNLPFSDDASIENALHALTFSIEVGLPVERAEERIGNIEPVSMRLEMLQGIQGSVLINDAYNSDIGGLAAALDLMNQQDHRDGKLIILSDLLQSDLENRVLYAEIASLIHRKGIEQFIGIGPAMMQHRALFSGDSLFFHDTGEFLRRMDRTWFKDRTVLIKGSRKFGFERITGELQLKTHQTLLEIDLNAMVHNLNYFRSQLKDRVKIMVMVKALSYGSGNLEIANFLQYHKVDYLAVAFIDEGVELRKAGIYLPIMVLNPDPSGFSQMLDYQLEPEIYSFKGVEALYEIIHYRGIKQYPIHIKLDTGMHRLGFQDEEVDALVPWLKHEEFRVASVFSHLAASDESEHDAFTHRQIRDFEGITSRLSDALKEPFDKHLLNSAGIERFRDAQYDMVRLGIGLHGIGLGKNLIPASSFITTISQVRAVKEGETIGYSRAGVASQDSRIATIPVGYADGMNRRLGNGVGMVWINGVNAPTIGNICMDMTMIDVTGLDVSEGDEVEIFGKYQLVTELANQAGTIPYEILTAIPERVKRVYLQE